MAVNNLRPRVRREADAARALTVTVADALVPFVPPSGTDAGDGAQEIFDVAVEGTVQVNATVPEKPLMAERVTEALPL